MEITASSYGFTLASSNTKVIVGLDTTRSFHASVITSSLSGVPASVRSPFFVAHAAETPSAE